MNKQNRLRNTENKQGCQIEGGRELGEKGEGIKDYKSVVTKW